MRLTKLIYLASPYSAKGKNKKKIEQKRYEQITKIAADLHGTFKYAFILPITMSHNTAKYMDKFNGSFKTWALRDYTYISKCDEVWVVKMKGWMESLGVQSEINFAKENNIFVRYVDAGEGE